MEDHLERAMAGRRVVEREIRTGFGMTGSALQRPGAAAPLDVGADLVTMAA